MRGATQNRKGLRPGTAMPIVGRRPVTAKETSPKVTRKEVSKPIERPGTARPKKSSPGAYIEKMRAEKKKNDIDAKFDPTYDYFPEVRKLRKEMEKEFGGPLEEDPKLEWLKEMDETMAALDDNFYKSSCIDDSPMVAFNDAADKVIAEMKPGDDLVASAKKMINSGFDAIHEKLATEGELLDQRIQLLQRMHTELLQHQGEFTADMEPDDYDNIMKEIESAPPSDVPNRRPLTARAIRPKIISS